MSRPGSRWGELLTIVAVGIVFTPVLWAIGGESDYTVHAGEAQYWSEHGTTRIPLPNFLFAGLAVVAHAVIPVVGFLGSALAVALVAQITLGVLLFRALSPEDAVAPPIATALLALSLMLIMPVNLFTAPSHNLYFGYLAPSPHHNPTLVLLKPLAWLAFVAATRTFAAPPATSSPGRLTATALIVALGTLAKPNFTMVLLPSLALALGLGWRRGAAVDARAFWLGFAIPGAGVLAAQYAVTFSAAQVAHPSNVESGIAFAPLAVMRALSPEGLGAKFLLSVLFPVSVVAAFPGEARRDPTLGFAWLCFAVGAFVAYGFSETGPRALDGNFLWSGQITLFVLFVVSLRFALERMRDETDSQGGIGARVPLVVGVYGLHVAAGLLWLAVQGLHRIDPTFPILRDWF